MDAKPCDTLTKTLAGAAGSRRRLLSSVPLAGTALSALLGITAGAARPRRRRTGGEERDDRQAAHGSDARGDNGDDAGQAAPTDAARRGRCRRLKRKCGRDKRCCRGLTCKRKRCRCKGGGRACGRGCCPPSASCVGGFCRSAFGRAGTGTGEFDRVEEIAVAPNGVVWVADGTSTGVSMQLFTPAGGFIRRIVPLDEAGNRVFSSGLTIDRESNFWLSDAFDDVVRKFDRNGGILAEASGNGTTQGRLDVPLGIAVNGVDDLTVVDSANNRIQVFNGFGFFRNRFGQSGTDDGEFDSPQAVAVDATGNVYVTDFNNDRVQKFAQNGDFRLAFGVRGALNGQFNGPSGIATHGDSVWVLDAGNQRLQQFGADGHFRQALPLGDTGQAVAVSADGIIFVNDPEHGRVLRFAPV